MAKTRQQLEKMNKQQVIDYALEISKQFQSINEKLDLLMVKLSNVEKQANRNSQYSRRETLEIHGIPESISDNDLEKTVIGIFNNIKEADEPAIVASNIHACHRMEKKDRVIIKFLHRKDARRVSNNRRKLKDANLEKFGIRGNIFLNESMCDTYKRLHYSCKLLWKAKLINSFWLYNGNLNVKLSIEGERFSICHSDDLPFRRSYQASRWTRYQPVYSALSTE